MKPPDRPSEYKRPRARALGPCLEEGVEECFELVKRDAIRTQREYDFMPEGKGIFQEDTYQPKRCNQ